MKNITMTFSIALITSLILCVSMYGENNTTPFNLKKRVLILEGTATEKYFNKSITGEALSIMWSNFLKHKGAVYEIVSQDQFANKNLQSYDILILPFILCLSDSEIEKIKEFASEKEKGLILDGFTGARDEKGSLREPSFLSEILGGNTIKEIKGMESSINHLILDGTSSFISDIDPGFRLEVSTNNKPICVNIYASRSEIDGYWAGNPVIYKNKISSGDAGIVHGRYIEARFAWLGFTMGSVTGNIDDQVVFQNLLDNLFNYVSFWPVIYKNRWPKGERAAVIFAQDTEDKFENALNTVSLLTTKNIPATFFCVPELASKYDNVFKKIYSVANFEIGLHGIEVYPHQSFEVQQERLKAGKETLEKIIGKKIRGFRPPQAVYDSNTLQALFNLDYDYIAGDDIKQAGPKIMPDKNSQGRSTGRSQKVLVKFPKTGNDDYDLLERYKMQDKAKMLELLKQDFDRIYKIGGLYFYSFHTQLMAKEEYIDVLGKFIDYVKEKDVWIASFSEVNDWWVKRSGLGISGFQTGVNHTSVKITNNSRYKVEAVKVALLLPPYKKLVKAYFGKSNAAVPFYEGQDESTFIDIQNIESGENAIIDIEYE